MQSAGRDFVHDQLATGSKLRVLTVVDTWSRFSPVIDPKFRYRGEDVVATLDRVYRKIGYPATIRVDNGSEFISRDLDLWAYAKTSRSTSHGRGSRLIELSRRHRSEPDGEGVHRGVQQQAPGGMLERTLVHEPCRCSRKAGGLAPIGRLLRNRLPGKGRDYTEVRPHSAIGYNVPIDLHNPDGATSPSS